MRRRAAPRPRRQRSATESLLSIVLVLESFVAFFLALAAYSLEALPPIPALIGGAALFLALVVVSRLLRRQSGIVVGFVLQAVLIATGILIPAMYAIGGGFLALWIYCYVVGRRLDRANGRRLDGSLDADPSS